MAITCAHPDPADLEAFALGALADAASVEAHVAECPSCQERVADVAVDSLVELLREAHARSAAPADTVSLTPPESLGRHERYRVLRLVGEGGMGSVYEAEHRLMRRRVALKVIRRPPHARPATLDRFRREARAAAHLSHPNIVTTFDAEDDGDCLFLAMEYVEGATLGRLVRDRGPLPAAEACGYVIQAALGLQHAHEHGLTHRDVKPDNLIRCPDGAVKVLDFGLASLTAERGDGLTDANVVMGTPDFMAPEQAEDSQRADARSDVYSLGCTLYHLLTGRVPYPAPTALLKVLAHREQPLPPLPDAPPGLARVLRRMLAKRPEGRFQTPAEVATALEPFTRPPQPPRRWPWLLAAAVMAILVAAAATVIRVETDRGTLVITAESDDVEVIVRQAGKAVRILDTKTDKSLTLYSGVYELELKGGEGLKLDIDKVTLKRGDTVLATVERVAKPTDGTVKLPAEQKVGLIRRTPWHGRGVIFSAVVSPDGRYYLAAAGDPDGTARLWDLKTGKELHAFAGAIAYFTPDSKQVLTGSWNNVQTVFRLHDVLTGKEVRSFGGAGSLSAFRILPNGKWAASLTDVDTYHIWELATGKEVLTFPCERGRLRGLFSSDGNRFLYSPDGKPYRVVDLETGKEVSAFKKMLDKKTLYRFLPGDLEVIGYRGTTLQRYEVASGKLLRELDLGRGADFSPESFSPDGRRILAVYPGGTYRLWDLLTGKVLHSFATDPVNPRLAAISPDGRYAIASDHAAVYLWRLPDAPAADKARP